MRKKIMVVEDDKDIRDIIGQVLSEENYEVNLLPDVRSFRKAILSDKPNLVILDVRLPDGNGLWLCKELKADERTGDIAVLMMSAHASVDDMNNRRMHDDFLAKPFNLHELLSRVDAVLN